MKEKILNIRKPETASAVGHELLVMQKIKPAICKECGEVYIEPSLIEDFIDGVCLPCRVEKECNELYAEWDRELKILNERLNTNYDFDSFCEACYLEMISRNDLKGLEELKQIHKDEAGRRFEREYGDDEKDFEIQLDLFAENLPF